MQGVAFLLAVCVAGVTVFGVSLLVRSSQREHERAGYFGRAAQRRHLDAEADVSEIAAIVERSDRQALSEMVEQLDRLAFAGVPLRTATPVGRRDTWSLLFRDGTAVVVHTTDGRALRRATALARRDALVVSTVHPLGDAVVVALRTPHHAPMRVALSA